MLDTNSMLVSLLAFLLPIPEYGSSLAYSAYTQVPVHAPIMFNECEASTTKARGIYAHSSLEYGAAFTLVGDRPATRVRLRFAFDDRTWHAMRTSTVDVTGTFTPGSKISRTHHHGGPFKEPSIPKEAVAVVCSPEEIDFADGSTWRDAGAAPMPSTGPSATPSPSSAPSPSPIPDPE